MLDGHEEESKSAWVEKLKVLELFLANRTHLSKNWTPIIEHTPMYKKTPKSTAMGIFFKIGEAKIESPIMSDTKKPDNLCSLMSATFGESPGAWFLSEHKKISKNPRKSLHRKKTHVDMIVTADT